MGSRQFFLAALVSALFYAVSYAQIRYVPSQYPTIQAAIDAAQDGDEIVVADGVYAGEGNRNIDFLGKFIILRSENGPSHCIIDASDEVEKYRSLILTETQGGVPVIEGFTFLGGRTAGGTGWAAHLGGSILCLGVAPIIRNCIFYGNSADELEGYGGAVGFLAMFCVGDPLTLNIKNCSFYGNAANKGGAIGILGSFNNGIRIIDSIFKNNTATNTYYRTIGGEVIAKCGPVWTSADFSILDCDYLTWGQSNNSITSDAQFADPDNLDFHLKSQQGRWDAFNQEWIKDDVTCIGVDFGNPDDDYSNEPWPHGKRINAGAYGNTPEASLSVVSCGNPADVTGTDMANLEDFAFFAAQWKTARKPVRSDFDRDGSVGLPDLLTLMEHWLTLTIDPTLSVDETVVVNDPISVSFGDMPGNAADWLGICERGASIEPYAEAMEDWLYTDGTNTGTAGITEGMVVFAGIMEPGDYEVRLFFDDGYAIKASRFFTVVGADD